MTYKLTDNYKNLFRKRLQSGMLLAGGCATMKLIPDCLEGCSMVSVIAGILVCAFVYVIRESLLAPGEEDYES